ncbi:MAG: SEC-C domain-containing protein [Gammaproteobacteria bacterium]|nr:SEC-C domain-containing protein [Gammaproteobacteria bacterium]
MNCPCGSGRAFDTCCGRLLAGRASRLHETSRFVREDGRWWYVDGEVRG